MKRWWAVGLVFLIAFAVYGLCQAHPTVFKKHVFLASAMLHGHLWLNLPAVWEPVYWGNHYYTIHPPMSAVLCIPFVLLWRLFGFQDFETNQTLVCVFWAAVSIAACFRYLGTDDPNTQSNRYGSYADRQKRNHDTIWITLFFALGTVFWYEGTLGAEWGMALVCSTLPTFLALTELKGECRPGWVALWGGVAALTRYDLVLAWPAYALWVLNRKGWQVWRLFPGFALAGIAYYWFQFERFGVFHDITLTHWYGMDLVGTMGNPHLGPFSIHYLPAGIMTALFMGPVFQQSWPYLRPHAAGQCLWLTSPALILATRAKLSREALLLWLAIGMVMTPALCVWANGYEQLGARYWIMVLPFFVALMSRVHIDRISKVLISWSIFDVGLCGLIVRWYGWP